MKVALALIGPKGLLGIGWPEVLMAGYGPAGRDLVIKLEQGGRAAGPRRQEDSRAA